MMPHYPVQILSKQIDRTQISREDAHVQDAP